MCSLARIINVAPNNPALPPLRNYRNQQVTVSPSVISPVTSYGSTLLLPLVSSSDE